MYAIRSYYGIPLQFDKAEEAYALVTGNTEPRLGVVLSYGAREKSPVDDLRVPIVV